MQVKTNEIETHFMHTTMRLNYTKRLQYLEFLKILTSHNHFVRSSKRNFGQFYEVLRKNITDLNTFKCQTDLCNHQCFAPVKVLTVHWYHLAPG